jgi:hypothetical protein
MSQHNPRGTSRIAPRCRGASAPAIPPKLNRACRRATTHHPERASDTVESIDLSPRRQPDPDNAHQAIYTLTEKGKDLIPALLELARWGMKHVPRSVAPKNLARRIKEDCDRLIEELKSALK